MKECLVPAAAADPDVAQANSQAQRPLTRPNSDRPIEPHFLLELEILEGITPQVSRGTLKRRTRPGPPSILLMQYTRLGSTGLQVSRICLGTMSFGNMEEWMIEIDKARPIIKRALDLGVNFFDTANVYSNGRSEEIVGELLKDQREEVVLASKVRFSTGEGPNREGLSREHIMEQSKKSLKRLKTDRIDLYQIHRWDYATPIEETLVALNDLVRRGLVNYIGASSMYAWQFAKALFTSDRLGLARFVSMQNHYNLCYREEEREMIPLCNDQGIGLIPWSPLARGFLTGRYKRGQTPDSARYRTDKYFAERFFRPEDFDVAERAEEVAKEKDVTTAQIALAWLLRKGVSAPIIGATNVQQIEEAVASLDVKLTDDEMKRLEEPYKTHRIIGPLPPESEQTLRL